MARSCRLFGSGLLFLLLVLFFVSNSLQAAEGKLLVFGRIQDDPVKAIRARQEFVDYIGRKLAPRGITGGRILVVDKISLLAQAIREGKVDFFHDSVVPTLVLSKWSGSIPILRQWKYGEAEYHGIILVKKNGGNSLADLRGKVIAFDEPHSTSAHVLPQMLFTEKKLKLVQVISPGVTRPDAVGFIHTSDGNAPNLLINGQVDAAATSPREFEKELRPEIRETLKVIARTKSVPRLLISVRRDLDPKIAQALKEILLNMDKDPEGQGVLKKQQQTSKIDEIPPESRERLKDIERFVFSRLGKEIYSW